MNGCGSLLEGMLRCSLKPSDIFCLFMAPLLQFREKDYQQHRKGEISFICRNHDNSLHALIWHALVENIVIIFHSQIMFVPLDGIPRTLSVT